MIKNIIISFLLLVLLILVFLIFIGTPSSKSSLKLEPQALAYHRDKAEKCNMESIQKLMLHYAVSKEKEEAYKWQRKEKTCNQKSSR